MYLKIQGILTDKDLQTYASVHLTTPYEWDPSVLDFIHSQENWESDWTNDPTENFEFDPKFGEFDDYINKSLSITPQISSTHDLLDEHTTHTNRE